MKKYEIIPEVKAIRMIQRMYIKDLFKELQVKLKNIEPFPMVCVAQGKLLVYNMVDDWMIVGASGYLEMEANEAVTTSKTLNFNTPRCKRCMHFEKLADWSGCNNVEFKKHVWPNTKWFTTEVHPEFGCIFFIPKGW